MALTERVQKAWKQADLEPIRLHGARHSYASLLIAAGVNPKEIQTYMGHASIQVTFNTYGHLFPGNESKTAVLIDAYIAQERGPVGGPTRAAAV